MFFLPLINRTLLVLCPAWCFDFHPTFFSEDCEPLIPKKRATSPTGHQQNAQRHILIAYEYSNPHYCSQFIIIIFPWQKHAAHNTKCNPLKMLTVHVQQFSGFFSFSFFLLTSRLFILAIKIIPGKHFVPDLAQWIPPVKRVTTVWISIDRVVCYSIPSRFCNITNLCAIPWKFTFQEQRFSSAAKIPAFTAHCPARVQLLKSKIT